MAQSQPTDQPPHSPTAMSRLAVILVRIAIVVVLSWLVLVLFSVIAPWFRQPIVPRPEEQGGVGGRLAFLELAPLTGGPPRLSLTDLQDHVTLLNFWGTWCPPCRQELPHVAELRERFAGQKAFRLVAISYPPLDQGEDLTSLRENTAALLKQLNLDLPTYCDPNDATRAAVDRVIGFEGFPTTLLLDRRGVIRAIWVGYRSGVETEIERYVDKVLGEGK